MERRATERARTVLERPERHPKTKENLISKEQTQRGRRLVCVLDPGTEAMAALEPWEYAVLILTDGTRSAAEIADLVEDAYDGRTLRERDVEECHRFFARNTFLDADRTSRESDRPSAPPREPSLDVAAKLQILELDQELLGVPHTPVLAPVAPFADGDQFPSASQDDTVCLPRPDELLDTQAEGFACLSILPEERGEA